MYVNILLRETRVALRELVSQYIDVRCKHILILFIVDVVPRSIMQKLYRVDPNYNVSKLIKV